MQSIYPQSLEHYWIERALKHFKTSDLSEAIVALEPAVRYLSDQFTIERTDDFAHYSEDPELLAAYGLFFFPQTYARIRFPLEEIQKYSSWHPPEKASFKILDLGCGTGAASLSVADALKHPQTQMTGWDQSSQSLKHFENLARLRQLPLQTVSRDLLQLPIKTKPHIADLVIMSFSLNELFQSEEPKSEWLQSLWNLVDEKGLLLILDPALHQTPIRLEKIREFFRLQQNATILAPCLHAHVCPLLSQPKTRCHEVRQWTPPESLQQLNKSLYREISLLKFSFLAVQKSNPIPEQLTSYQARMISPMIEENGKTVFHGCAHDGFARKHEILHRHLSKSEKNDLLEIPRGTRIEISDYEKIGKPEAIRTQKISRL